MEGFGTFTWPDGKYLRYVGEYANDMKQGEGTLEYRDGSKYIGAWDKGKQHGRGILIDAMGQQRIGEWERGNPIRWLDR
jgi:hypothetical protein